MIQHPQAQGFMPMGDATAAPSDNKMMWIALAGIGVVAAAGVAYFVYQDKKTKEAVANEPEEDEGEDEDEEEEEGEEAKEEKPAPRALPNRAAGVKRCPVGTEVQTLIFDKDVFNKTKSVNWARKHKYSAKKVDDKANTFRIRQRHPFEFKSGSMRTIKLTEGVQAVIGCPRKK